MIAQEKIVIARFLDLAGDYLKDGYKREREEAVFTDSAEAENSSEASGGLVTDDAPGKEKPTLPLAYLVEEPELSSVPEDNNAFTEASDSLEKISAEIASCKACGLCAARTLAVPGEGAAHPLVMVVGEAPGTDEDRSGRPFVGKAGQLLDKMLESIGLSRNKNCFIANMVKCRPPENRDPAPEEIAACFPFLERQIALLRPELILCARRVAAQSLLKTGRGINALRGEFAEFRSGETLIPVLATFHPSALLRDESLKRPAWEDLKLLRSRLASLNDENEEQGL